MEHSLSLRSRLGHELRTPLSAIIGLLDLLRSTNPNPEQESYIADLELSAHQLLQSEERIFLLMNEKNH